ncbi:MAG: hypothetical protein ACKO2K_06985, partial [Alphaproteobacteria bacterium]
GRQVDDRFGRARQQAGPVRGDRFGRLSVIAALAAMASAAVAWSIASNRTGLLTRATDPIVDLPSAGGVAVASLVALCILLARSIWRSGLRNWLARLGEAPALAATGAEPHHHHHHG